MLFGKRKKNKNASLDTEETLAKSKDTLEEKKDKKESLQETLTGEEATLSPDKDNNQSVENITDHEHAEKTPVEGINPIKGKEKELAAKAQDPSLKQGYTTEDDILAVLAQQLGMPYVDLTEIEPDPELIALVPTTVARSYKVLPLYYEDGNIVVAMVDPTNITTLDTMSLMLNATVKGAIAKEDEILELIDQYFGDEGETVDDMLEALQQKDFDFTVSEEDFGDMERIANEAPIIKLVNLLLLQAIKDRASDLHIEPYQTSFRIRYRVDGTLHETVPPPRHLQLAIISRIKVMANMNIAERRLPQDGRIKLTMADKEIDLRVSAIPTVNGESIVMRILDKSMMMIGLEQIGLANDVQEIFEKIIHKPNGIVLVTGPTGSGKTTTLYAVLVKIFSPMLKMITTEEPVEYQMEGIVQVNINERIGLTFASCLRAILRQDPDIIMVGEIRDLETAQISIEAALTGHLVFSTIHTNDAPSTVTRLIDMNVEPFLVTSTIEAVLAQRLVRTVCSACREPYKPNQDLLEEVGVSPEEAEQITFYHGKGCVDCNYTGYRGRIGLFELLVPTEPIKEMILARASSAAIREQARKEGMRTLRDDGWEKVINGITTVEELLRETL